MDTERFDMQTTTTFYLDMQTTPMYLDRQCFIGIRRQRAELVRSKLNGFGPVPLLRMPACFSFHIGALHSAPLASSVHAYFV
ncbi:hypothetical protein F442_13725 [Phytophthora nicotianae P10297]|uniref:Uncharacterized protein n=1 Tax=Phytophthora nicotianae P10297 TaxID=1317064 RepID=W2YUE3_PHYNI|nr:hypothetical protein F442_13725 [Phytophthora nicotianae P10297]